MSIEEKIKNMAWFEKYRAKELDEYVFQNEELESFAKSVYDNEMFPGNTLFYGKPGTGKTNLAQILIRKVIKHKADLFIIRERSVKEIDEIKNWIQKPAYKSKQKIVFAEEADRILQSKQAIAELKTITEKYQPSTIFLFITNYVSKFVAADPALLTRFTYRFEFNALPEDKVIDKLKFILDNEGIKYNEQDLKEFVKQHISIGLRELINKLQVACISGTFKPVNVLRNTTVEEEIVEYYLDFINRLLHIGDPSRLIMMNNIFDIDELAAPYTKIVTILQNDKLIDYEYILQRILENLWFIPFYKITIKYLEDLQFKKYKNIHLVAMLYEYIETYIRFMKNGF